MRLGDAGEHDDLRGDGAARVDEGLEGAEALTAAELHRTDLGDAALGGRPAGGLEVDDDERRTRQRRPGLVEGHLVLVRGHRVHATASL